MTAKVFTIATEAHGRRSQPVDFAPEELDLFFSWLALHTLAADGEQITVRMSGSLKRAAA